MLSTLAWTSRHKTAAGQAHAVGRHKLALKNKWRLYERKHALCR